MITKYLLVRRFIFCCLIYFSIANCVSAQTVIYSPNFSVNGATSGNNWRVLSSNNCDGGFFGAQNGSFVINDWEGTGCVNGDPLADGNNDNLIQIGPVNVASANCVRVEYTIAASGNFEFLGAPGADLLEITVLADGVPFNVDINSGNNIYAGSPTRSINLPFGTSSVTIDIAGGNQAIDEVYSISNIRVLDVGINPVIPDIEACTDQTVNLTPFQSGIPGIWSGTGVAATTWVTIGLNPGTYPLTFEPFDPCASPVTVMGTVNGGGLAGSSVLGGCGTGATAFFNLTLADDDIRNGASGEVFWFTDILKNNPIPNPTNYEGSDGDEVYGAYRQGDCLSEAGILELNITAPQDLVAPPDVEACGSYTLPALDPGVSYVGFSVGSIILSDEIIEITSGSGTCVSSASFEVTISSGPMIDAYSGATQACDSLLLPPIAGTNLSGNEAYYTESGGEGERFLAGEFLNITGLNTFYMYDEAGICTNEVTFDLDIAESGVINARDTIVCDTFAFLPYQGTGNFLGYFSEKGGNGTQYNPGDGLKQGPSTVKVYVRAGTGTCVSEDSFNITFRVAPDIASISAFDVCDTISLPLIGGDELSGNQAYYTLSGGQGTRLLPGTVIDTTTTLFIYDRIGSCEEELLFTVLVIPQPKFDPIPDQVVCDTFVLPPIAGEDLTSFAAYSSGLDGTGVLFSPGDILTTDQTVYLYDERARCTTQDSFQLTFNYRPQLLGPIGEQLACDTFTLPAITGIELLGDEVITTAPLGVGDTLLPGAIFTDSTILYLTAGAPGCQDTQRLELRINPQPFLAPVSDTLVCDYFILPEVTGTQLTGGAAYFDTPGGLGNRYLSGDTLRSMGPYYVYDETEIGCMAEDTLLVSIGITPQLTAIMDTVSCGPFNLPEISGTQLNAPVYADGPLGTGTRYLPGDLLTSDLQVYVYDEDMGCFDSTLFTLRVLPPVMFDIPFRDTMVCDSFLVPTLTGSSLTGNEGYFSEPLSVGDRFLPGTILRDSTVLYAFGGQETCIDTATIRIHIQPTPKLDAVADVVVCDFYVLPVPSGQDLTDSVIYFDVNEGRTFLAGDTLSLSRTLEVRDTNSFGCGDVQRFQVQVTPRPQLVPMEALETCDSFILEPIQGQFLPSNTAYYTEANGLGQVIPVGTVFNTSQDIFIYADSLGCVAAESFSLTVNYTPEVDNALPGSTNCFNLELPVLTGNNLSANIGYYTQPNGQGLPLELPFDLKQDITLYLFGNNGTCTLADTLNFEVNAIEANLVITDFIECNGDLGSISITDLNVEAPFTLNWNDPSFFGLSTLDNLPEGTYSVLITDANGCELNQSISLVEPDPLLFNCTVVQQISAPNGQDGQLQLDFSGGTLPYTLILSGAQIDTLVFNTADGYSLDNLAPGTYNFQLIDANTCQNNCSLEIIAPPCILEANLRATDITCFGFQNGTLVLDITGGQSPLSIDWSDDTLDGRTSILDASAGTYTVTVTDVNGCIDSSMAVISEPTPLQITTSEIQPVSNAIAEDGSVEVTFSGGIGPYTLVWSGPEMDTLLLNDTNSRVIDSLFQGEYLFEIMDANGCQITDTVIIGNPNCGMTIQFLKQDQTCPNTEDGQLAVVINGGVAPYRFLWGDGSTDSIRTNLNGGTYSVQVFDSETCVAQGLDSINAINPLPSITLSSSTVQCDSTCQEVILLLEGTAPFNYNWKQEAFIQGQVADTMAGSSTLLTENTESLLSCLPGDSLAVSVFSLSDAFCSTDLDTSFGFHILPVPVLMVNDTLCENDSLRLGSQIYTQSNPSDTIVLTNQANNGCDSLIYVDLTFIEIVYDTIRQTLCQEDSLLVNGTVYDWNNPSGTEIFSASDINFGCDSVVYIELNFNPTDTAELVQTLCSAAFLDIGGTRFDQNNPNGLARIDNAAINGCDSLILVDLTFVDNFNTDLQSRICVEDSVEVNGTIYNFLNPSGNEVYTAQSGCDSIIQVDLLFFPVDTQFVEPILCPGDSIVVNGITYNENTPFDLQTIPRADTNGCNSIIKIDLTYLENVQFDFSPTICLTDTIFVNGTAYHAFNPSGTEILEDAAQNGCDSLVNVNVQFFSEIRTVYRDTLCNLDSLVVNGTVYNLANPSGVERLQAQGLNGCDSIVEINLDFRAPIRASLQGTTAICAGISTALTLEVDGASTYDVIYQTNNQSPITQNEAINGDQFIVQPMENSIYRLLEVRDTENGCQAIVEGAPVQVVVSELDVSVNQLSNFGGFGVSCAEASDGRLIANADDGIAPYRYTWNTGASTASLENLSSGTYIVNIIDDVGCLGGDTVQLIAPPPLDVSFSASPSICASNPNGEIMLNSISGGTGNYRLSLNGQFFTQITQLPVINGGLNPGTYQVFVQDGNNCEVSTNLTIAEEIISLDLGADIDLKIGDSIQLKPEANFPLLDFIWTPTIHLSNPLAAEPFVSPELTTAYTLTAFDPSGCSITDNVIVYVDQTRDIYRPTAFTPDENGINDRFTIFGGPDLVEIEILQVYDRWGNLLYEGNGLPPSNDQVGWDGKYRNERMTSGTYIYRAVLRFTNGGTQEIKGEVSLMR